MHCCLSSLSISLCVCVLSCQGCGSLVSVSRSAGALSCRSTEDSSLPEILLGLIYNSATGQLSAEVIQGSHFKTTASEKPVSTYKTLESFQLLGFDDVDVTFQSNSPSICAQGSCLGKPDSQVACNKNKLCTIRFKCFLATAPAF